MLEIKENIPLSNHTTFRIGGPARFFCEVRNEQELEEAVKFANGKKIAAFIMGEGSNLLISDKGFDGLVIKFCNQSEINQPQVKIKMENGNYFIECWAGENLGSIVKLAADSSMTGLEWATGIPGTIGGAVRGNAGAYGSWMKDIIFGVKIMEGNNLKFSHLGNDQCDFEYRESIFKKRDDLIVATVVIKLAKGDKNIIVKKMDEIMEKRNSKIPKEPSPGSYFKNPTVNNNELISAFEKDKGVKSENNRVPAPWLISEAGLQGKKIGRIKISEKHANFIVNLGGGKAEEVVMLASIIKQKIRDNFGVELQEEIKYVGF